MSFDPGLAQRIRDLIADRAAITERRMFGGLAFMSHGNMFVGVLGTTLMARVGPDAYADALDRPHARVMDFTGRPMKGYVFVDSEGVAEDGALEEWIRATLQFVDGLPRKPVR